MSNDIILPVQLLKEFSSDEPFDPHQVLRFVKQPCLMLPFCLNLDKEN